MSDETYTKGMEYFRSLNAEGARNMEAALTEIAPDLMRYAAAFPFGEIYQREGLATRERQIVTLSALASIGAIAQLKVHLGIARSLGLTREEVVEVFIQLVPYVGFPVAINATLAAVEIFADDGAASAAG